MINLLPVKDQIRTEGGRRDRQGQEGQEDPEDQEQDLRSAGVRSYQDHHGPAFPCSEEGEGQDGKEYLHQSCSEIVPSSDEHESCQWDNPASG